MMVKRSEGQLVYTVQFHLEKSFQDLDTNHKRRVNPNLPPRERKRMLREEASSRTRWAHKIESRDGRVLFENFLREAIKHSEQSQNRERFSGGLTYDKSARSLPLATLTFSSLPATRTQVKISFNPAMTSTTAKSRRRFAPAMRLLPYSRR